MTHTDNNMDEYSWQTVHRFIPPGAKHGAKTACGIPLAGDPLTAAGSAVIEDTAGALISVSMKGQPFDCKRCRVVLERRHQTKETA